MEPEIYKRGNKWFATNGHTKISTTKTTKTHKLKKTWQPIFKFSNEIFEIFPWLREALRDRFKKAHVKRRISEFVDSKCWITTMGTSTLQGYVQLRFSFSKQGFYVDGNAHILSYLLFKGQIPKAKHLPGKRKQVQHKCGKECCANPDHLEAGVARQNTDTALSQHVFAHYLNSSWKITPSQVSAIRYLYHEKIFSVEMLCNIFALDENQMYRIINFDSWQAVDMSDFFKLLDKKRSRHEYTPNIDQILLEGRHGAIPVISKLTGLPEGALQSRRTKLRRENR